MMTRKDYIKTAEILRTNWDGLMGQEDCDTASVQYFKDTVRGFAKYFASDNTSFDTNKFLESIYRI